MASEIEGCELDVANGELLGSCGALDYEALRLGDSLTGVQSCVAVSNVYLHKGGAIDVLG